VIAQVSIPSEGLSPSYFSPLMLALVLYAVLFVAARVLSDRNHDRATTVDNAAFVVMLLAGVYVVVIALVALASEIDLVLDMLLIVGVIIAFFAVLVGVLLVVFERGVGGLLRARRDRKLNA